MKPEFRKSNISLTASNIFFSGLLLFCSSSISANSITVSESQDQTVDFQNFSFDLNTNNYQSGTSSTLTLTVQGDFNGASSGNENIASLVIEGTSFGNFDINSTDAYNITDYTAGVNNFNAYEFSVDFLLDSASTSSFLSDSILNVFVDFGSGVHVDCGWSGPSNCTPGEGNSPFAAVIYTYQDTTASTVPEPTSLALIGLGLAGISFLKKRKI